MGRTAATPGGAEQGYANNGQFMTTPEHMVSPNQVHIGSASSPTNLLQTLGYVFRGAGLVLALVATIVMGAAKQTASFLVVDAFGNLYVDYGTAQMSDSSAFIYFTAANAIVVLYSIIALILLLVIKSKTTTLSLSLSIADIFVLVMLFSCNGAATAIALVAENGYDSYEWGKICGIAGKFCSQFTAAIVLSMVGAAMYAVLIILALVKHKSY